MSSPSPTPSTSQLKLDSTSSSTSTATPAASRHEPAVIAARRDKPLYSLIAGATAGAVEGFVTYPIEYTKTVAQFAQRAGEKVSPSPSPVSACPALLSR